MLPDLLNLAWSPPAAPGSSTVGYDAIRSADPADFTTAFLCVESNDASDTAAQDPQSPGPGGICYYLVRAGNACGKGPLGFASDGAPQPGLVCP